MTATSKPDQAPARSRGPSRARRRGPRNRDGNPPHNGPADGEVLDVDTSLEEGDASSSESTAAAALHLSELKALHVSELLAMAIENDVEGANRLRKQELVFALLKNRARKGEPIYGDGALEVLPDGFGFLRSPDTSYLAGTDDIYVSPSQIRRFNLRTGDTIEGEIRTPKDGERYFALVKLDKINGRPPEECKSKILFENLTPLHPQEVFRLEREIRGEENITSRVIDMIAPIGKGQRGLLVAPPK
ncbi:MAG: transcription termination factor Rho, partial [Thauera phenolivorans]|nr:transcription termination factor Rho [Thauera phenolivorans]